VDFVAGARGIDDFPAVIQAACNEADQAFVREDAVGRRRRRVRRPLRCDGGVDDRLEPDFEAVLREGFGEPVGLMDAPPLVERLSPREIARVGIQRPVEDADGLPFRFGKDLPQKRDEVRPLAGCGDLEEIPPTPEFDPLLVEDIGQ